MNFASLIVVFVLFTRQIRCDRDTMLQQEACRRNRLLIFDNYYTVLEPISLNEKHPMTISVKNRTIMLNEKNENLKSYIYWESNTIFLRDGKLYISIKNQTPKLIFEIKNQWVHSFSLDINRDMIFALTRRCDRGYEKCLYAVKLRDLEEHKNRCPWVLIDATKNYTSMYINWSTGELLLGYVIGTQGYIDILKPSNFDPCEEFTDVSALTRGFEMQLQRIRNDIAECARENENLKKINKGLNRLLTMHTAWLKQLLNDKKGNETALRNEIEDLQLKLNASKSGRIKLGVQISYLVDEFKDVPLNMSKSFGTRVAYENVPDGEKANFECASKSEFDQNRKQNKFQDFKNKDLGENLEALMNEAIAPDEVEEFNSRKLTEDEIFESIFG